MVILRCLKQNKKHVSAFVFLLGLLKDFSWFLGEILEILKIITVFLHTLLRYVNFQNQFLIIDLIGDL